MRTELMKKRNWLYRRRLLANGGASGPPPIEFSGTGFAESKFNSPPGGTTVDPDMPADGFNAGDGMLVIGFTDITNGGGISACSDDVDGSTGWETVADVRGGTVIDASIYIGFKVCSGGESVLTCTSVGTLTNIVFQVFRLPAGSFSDRVAGSSSQSTSALNTTTTVSAPNAPSLAFSLVCADGGDTAPHSISDGDWNLDSTGDSQNPGSSAGCGYSVCTKEVAALEASGPLTHTLTTADGSYGVQFILGGV